MSLILRLGLKSFPGGPIFHYHLLIVKNTGFVGSLTALFMSKIYSAL